MIHGTHDTLALVEEARSFVQRLRDTSQEKVIYAELPGTQHAFAHFLSIRALYAVRAIARFGEWAFENFRASGGRPARPSDRAAAAKGECRGLRLDYGRSNGKGNPHRRM